MTTATADTAAIEALAERYGEAWNTQDLDGILARHAENGSFRLHVPGGEPVEGRDAIRAAFAGFLAQLPDIRFEPRRLLCGPGFWVLESTMTGTAAAPFDVDGAQVDAPGARIEVDAVDVITVRDGLVQTKDTYLDALAFQSQLEAKS
jgi:ketosteroid isomerase-like protein